MRVVVDAMGSDRSPMPEVAGAVRAALAGIDVTLVGDRGRLEAELARNAAAEPTFHIEIVHASEVVTMHDHPGHAFRAKPDSSLRVAVQRVADGHGDAIVSAGNSGAMLAACLFVLGRLDGIERPGNRDGVADDLGPARPVRCRRERRAQAGAARAVRRARRGVRSRGSRSRPATPRLARERRRARQGYAAHARGARAAVGSAGPVPVRRLRRGQRSVPRRCRRDRDRWLHRQRRAEDLRGDRGRSVRPGQARSSRRPHARASVQRWCDRRCARSPSGSTTARSAAPCSSASRSPP